MRKSAKRSKRRQRWKRRVLLRILDKKVLQEIQQNMLWSIETFGGSRCGGCGIQVRPHWLTNLSSSLILDGKKVGHLTAFGYACNHVKCPGENLNWSDRYL